MMHKIFYSLLKSPLFKIFAMALVFTVIAPLNTDEVPWLPRSIVWFFAIWLGSVFAKLIALSLYSVGKKLNYLTFSFIVASLLSFPMLVVAYNIQLHFGGSKNVIIYFGVQIFVLTQFFTLVFGYFEGIVYRLKDFPKNTLILFLLSIKVKSDYIYADCKLPSFIIKELTENNLGDLYALKQQGHYMEIIGCNGIKMIHMKMKDAVPQLMPACGMHIHRSSWVSYSAIKKISTVNNKCEVLLLNGLVIAASLANKKELVDNYAKYKQQIIAT